MLLKTFLMTFFFLLSTHNPCFAEEGFEPEKKEEIKKEVKEVKEEAQPKPKKVEAQKEAKKVVKDKKEEIKKEEKKKDPTTAYIVFGAIGGFALMLLTAPIFF